MSDNLGELFSRKSGNLAGLFLKCSTTYPDFLLKHQLLSRLFPAIFGIATHYPASPAITAGLPSPLNRNGVVRVGGGNKTPVFRARDWGTGLPVILVMGTEL